MIKTPAFRKCHTVRLDKPLPEDGGEKLNPDVIWASIEPAPPGSFDEEKIAHVVKCDYHPEITLNCKLFTEDNRHLWVRGIQNIEMRNIELWLLCEEVLTP